MAIVDQIGANIVLMPQRQVKPSADSQTEIPMVKPPSSDIGEVATKVSKPEVAATPQSPSPQELLELLNRVDLNVDMFEIQAKFSIDQVTGGIQIEVVNNKTGEVIRKIPPYEAVLLLLEQGNAIGLLMDQKV